MNKNTKRNPAHIIAALVLGVFAAGVAWADQTINQDIPFTVQSGGSGSGCPGAYTGYAKMTNGTSFWFKPPTNTASGTLTDASGFAPPYVSVAYAKRKSDGVSWCDTNSVMFPATNSTSYEFFVYVKNTPPPTNGQPLNLQVTWK